MRIDVGVVTARVVDATIEERSWVREYLTFPDKNARFTPSGKPKSMYGIMDNFPAGMVDLVVKRAPEEGYKVEVLDRTSPVPPLPAEEVDLGWLREDQALAVKIALQRRRGILHLPTSFGKTEVAVGLVRAVPAPWLLIVHRTTLARQAAERFERRSAEHGVDLGRVGIIGDGQWTEGERFTCATFQSLYAALKKGDPRARSLLERVRGLIVDEAHTLPSETFYATANAVKRADYRIGLSGTPLARGDRRSVLAIAAMGPVIYRVRTSVLVESGQAAKSKIRMVEVEQGSGAATWASVYNTLVVKSEKRNKALVGAALRAEKPALLFVKEIAHGRLLEKMLLRAGMRSAFVYGGHSEDGRDVAIDRLVRADLDVLVCSNIFQEGVDIPCLRSVINGAGGRSTIAALQRLGRGMRVERDAQGNVTKDTFELWDVFDRGNSWMERASRERRAAYTKEGHAVELVTDG